MRLGQTGLTPELGRRRKRVEEICREEGLDFYDTYFQMLSFDEMNEITANSGFPRRYPHWKFGMVYQHYKKQLGHGFGKIYELVVNNDPAIAYLLEYNHPIEQIMVIGHVYAHVDFFKNNYAFAETNRNMLNNLADHANLIQHYINKVGWDKVESFIDACLSLENLIDPHSVRIKRRDDMKDEEDEEGCESSSCDSGCGGCDKKDAGYRDEVFKLPAEEYMDRFINTPEFLEAQKKKSRMEKKKKKHFPPEPERDVMLFLLENADRLNGWQRDILSIIREEAYYFAPQMQTKIMNEGWATYWHSHLMTKRGLAGDDGIIHFARVHSSVMGSGKTQINPYRLGFQLFKDIEDRWNKGKYGLDYSLERDFRKRKKWDTGEMKGREKIFEVRRNMTDIEFIREFMTDDFIRDQMFYEFRLDPSDNWYKIANRDPSRIRNTLISQLTNGGEPRVFVRDGNFRNSRELLLAHYYDGQPLKQFERTKTIENIYKIWRRPVHLQTYMNEKWHLFSFDGKKHTSGELS
jgi:stage V sporulation protein R